MFAVVYITTVGLVVGLALYIHYLLKQQIEDVQTISYLRNQNMKKTQRILDLEAKIKMIEVF